MLFIIRNDVTGKCWYAHAAEAKLYAIGGLLDCWYSVFQAVGGGANALFVEEIKHTSS